MRFEIRRTDDRFWIRAATDDDEVLMHSHYHDTRESVVAAIALLQSEAADAVVVDMTDDPRTFG